MKKFLAIVMCAVLLLSCLMLSACDEQDVFRDLHGAGTCDSPHRIHRHLSAEQEKDIRDTVPGLHDPGTWNGVSLDQGLHEGIYELDRRDRQLLRNASPSGWYTGPTQKSLQQLKNR